ncbi:hypothetical protein D623_10026898 [Myotis brandtii]|uniref:Uncharacterized protein n=1 Tax=Myotis brandtii TaxID=109478 RepID=S7N0N7_MYOBR|nr:hypothetical protein D623_10026898 [Myotis brandtii]
MTAAPISPQEQGEVEKPSGAIRARSRRLHPLLAPSDQDRRQAWAMGTSGGSGASCRFKARQLLLVAVQITQHQVTERRQRLLAQLIGLGDGAVSALTESQKAPSILSSDPGLIPGRLRAELEKRLLSPRTA